MASRGLLQLSLVMFLTLLGSHRGQGQTLLMTPMLVSSSDFSNKIQSVAMTYPPTPRYLGLSRIPTTMPDVQSPFPYALDSSPTTAQTNVPGQNSALVTQALRPTMAVTTIPDLNPATNIPGGQSSNLPRLITPSRTTAQRSQDTTIPMTTLPGGALQTTLPGGALQTTVLPGGMTVRSTVLPQGVTGPSSTPQHVQISFNNKYDDVGITDYDQWGNRQNAQNQLAAICMISTDRITDVSIQPNSTGCIVMEFTIQQGYPIYTSEAVQILLNKMQSPKFLSLSAQQLDASGIIFWTDDGPCPVDQCMNGGLCNVNVSGSYECECSIGFGGSKCQYQVTPAPAVAARSNLVFLALLSLLVIPIGIALAVGFIFGRRRQQKQQLKRAFDLRDVRTIGPKSMLSLPQEPGIRNQMYDTRSFALAFTDTSFGKSSSPPTSEDDLMSYIGK